MSGRRALLPPQILPMNMREPPDDVTRIMNDAAAAPPGASEESGKLVAAVYDQLRAAAQKQMADERPGHTLAATALVHEAYLKLAGPREIPWQNRAHFYAAAAEAMRQVLLDHAKARGRLKRGGAGAGGHERGGRTGEAVKGRAARRVSLEAAATVAAGAESAPDRLDFIALDEAMRRLEDRDPRLAQVVRLKYYAGLEIAQVALVLGISERTVKNDWAFAKAWLERALDPTS